jgi:hypothetical protein
MRSLVNPQISTWWVVSVRSGFALARRTLGPAFLVAALMAFVAVPIVVGAQFVAVQSSGSGLITQIRVSPEREAPLTAATLDAVAALPHVDNVTIDATVGMYSTSVGAWSAVAAPVNLASLPPGISREVARGLGADDVIVPTDLNGTVLSDFVGSPLPVAYTRMVATDKGELVETAVQVVAAYDSSWQGYGPGVIVAHQDFVVKLLAAREGLAVADYLRAVGVPGVIVDVDSGGFVDEVATQLRDWGLVASPSRDSLGDLPGILAWFPILAAIVGVVGGILMVAYVTQTVRSAVRRRTKEFGLLRMRGWRQSDVRRLIVVDCAVGTGVGAVTGSALGYVLGVKVAGSVLEGVSESGAMPLLAAAAVAAGVIVLACAVALAVSHQALRRDPFLTLMTPG